DRATQAQGLIGRWALVIPADCSAQIGELAIQLVQGDDLGRPEQLGLGLLGKCAEPVRVQISECDFLTSQRQAFQRILPNWLQQSVPRYAGLLVDYDQGLIGQLGQAVQDGASIQQIVGAHA